MTKFLAAFLAILLSSAAALAQTASSSITLYGVLLTPAATAATIQTVEQTFTVAGLQVGDRVQISGPAPTPLCAPTTVRVSAANTLAIGFTVLTAAACTPAAGTYYITDIR